SRDVSHQGLGELQLVDTMHPRKAAMYDRSDAVIALPGGYGTLEELFEALTWTQLGLHALPAALLDVGGFWDPFVRFLDSCVDAGFLKPSNRQLLGVAHDPAEALSTLAGIDTAYREKWSG
ncbi:MAG: TIGR00730 family Rossman fold protein, partial [Actinomycetota bacterium]|nr:TIGR00730 family Rossman fold protein [Actinomycetota bacterium]